MSYKSCSKTASNYNECVSSFLTFFFKGPSTNFFSPVVPEAEDASSNHDLICFKFLRSMDADVLTSVFISMATAPTPTTVMTKFDSAMLLFIYSKCLH